MAELTDDYLDRLQAICDAATGGPWRLDVGREQVNPPHGGHVCSVYPMVGAIDDDAGEWKSNGELIAESRTALPLLVAEVRRLRAEVASVTAERDHARLWVEG